jgi:hypothetical protein
MKTLSLEKACSLPYLETKKKSFGRNQLFQSKAYPLITQISSAQGIIGLVKGTSTCKVYKKKKASINSMEEIEILFINVNFEMERLKEISKRFYKSLEN